MIVLPDVRVLVVRQHWAWLIFNGKDVENRPRRTHYRGPLLISASAHMQPRHKLEECRQFARARGVEIPSAPVETGGIIGLVSLDDCVTAHPSAWFEGPYGYVLSGARRLPFVPLKGQLGLFRPPQRVLDALEIRLEP